MWWGIIGRCRRNYHKSLRGGGAVAKLWARFFFRMEDESGDSIAGVVCAGRRGGLVGLARAFAPTPQQLVLKRMARLADLLTFPAGTGKFQEAGEYPTARFHF